MSTKRARASKTAPAAPAEDYTPTPREAEAARKIIERRKSARSVRLDAQNTAPGAVSISIKHPDEAVGHVLLMDALATSDEYFAEAITTQLGGTVTVNGEINAKKLNCALAMVTGIKPADEVEAMLAAQMAAVHNASMTAAAYLSNAGMLNQYETYTNSLNKLSRTFAAQVEALKKYRSSGEQSIRVQHFNVKAEQAMVGNVQTGGGGAHQENRGQPHEPRDAEPKALAYEPGTTMLSNVEALRPSLQGAGSERRERVPLPRSEGRRA